MFHPRLRMALCSILATGVLVGVPIKMSMLSYLRKKVGEGRRRIGHSIDVLTYNEQVVNALSLIEPFRMPIQLPQCHFDLLRWRSNERSKMTALVF